MAADDRVAQVVLDQDPRRNLPDRTAYDGPFAVDHSSIALFIHTAPVEEDS